MPPPPTAGDANGPAAAAMHGAAAPSPEGAGVAREKTRASPSPAGAPDAQRPVGRKRRRIPRACDDCRRRKIKCDGKRPCASCAEFDSRCTYNGPSVRGRGHASASASLVGTGIVGTRPASPSPARRPRDEAAALQKRLQAAESIIRRCLPQLDLAKLEDAASAQPAPAPPPPERPAAPASGADDAAADGARFIRLVGSADQLDLTDSGEYQFHGISSGAAFLSRIDQHFPGLLRRDSRMPFLPQPRRPSPAKPLELPVYSANPWRLEDHDHEHLPPRDLARDLCGYALSWGSCLLRVVHAPSFWTTFELLYTGRPQRHTNQQRRFVGLLFAVMALGSMYDVDENDPTNPDHYAVAIERGYKYYTSARHFLQDITECSDLVTLQAMVFLIQFLQATGNLNGCHTLIGIALRSALRMGLHRYLSHIPMSPIQDETRRRVFHSIRQLDIYLCTSLGLPIMLRDGDINQPRPTEVNDEYITENGIQPPPPGTPSFLEAFNAHLELMRILADVVDHLYPPPRGTDPGLANVTYVISCTRVREMEQALHDWHEKLGETWRPGPEENAEITRVKILLRSAYAHVQLMLYRPFLQYYSRRASADETADARYFAFAAAGINVCRNIIYIGLEIRRQGVLIGPYWFITNTQFFAILTLVLYVLYNPDKPEASELFADAKLGKECISGLTQRSMAADRVTAALNSFFDQLPARFRWADPPSPDAVPPVGPSRIEYQTSRSSRPPTQHRGLNLEGQESLNRRAPVEKPRSAGGMAADQQAPAPQPDAATIPRPAQYHEALNWMALPPEDPFAYPILPGVSLPDNDFSAFEDDRLRLPLYDLPPDMDGQLLQFQDPLHASLLPYMSTDPSETLYATLAASGNPSGALSGDAQNTPGPPPWGFPS